MQYLKTFFYELKIFFTNNVERLFLVSITDFLYHQNAHFILPACVIFKYTSLYIFFFMATKVNRSTKSDFFLQI